MIKWLAVGVCLLYAGFAVAVVVDEAAEVLGGGSDRSAPALFLVHALAGAIALAAGAVQLRLAGTWARRRPALHRALGRGYAGAAWMTSAGSLVVVASFDVSVVSRVLFVLGAVLWFGSTTVAVRHVRAGRVARHREWMVRSYALALFFLTFSVWQPLLPGPAGYPVAVFLSWALNLAAAELWLRRRARSDHAARPELPVHAG
jgi:uncharacterized membrane protein